MQKTPNVNSPDTAPGEDIRDIRVLGSLLGEVLASQSGRILFERVERIRTTARNRRQGSATAEDLDRATRDLSPAQATQVIRAFSTLCALTNLAERVHHLRQIREQHLHDEASPGTFEYALRHLSQHLPLDQVQRAVDRLQIMPVLTAHPTEVTRRTVLSKELRIAQNLLKRIYLGQLTRAEEQEILEDIRREIAITWQTNQHLTESPTVADEVEHALFYLANAIVPALPKIHQAFESAVSRVYGYKAVKIRGPIVRAASWVGGDMDGNPNVGPQTIRDTVSRHKEQALSLWRDEIRELFNQLSQSLSHASVEPELIEAISRYRAEMPRAAKSVPHRYEQMPYRVFIWFIWARLGGLDGRFSESPYPNPETLLTDLRLIADSLRLNRGEHAGVGLVMRLVGLIESCGFHLATLDIRQDAAVHRQALETLDALDAEETVTPEALARAERTLEVFRAIADVQRDEGPNAIGIYIISMAQTAEDVRQVLELAARSGDTAPKLDIAPLFETVEDLQVADKTLDTILSDPDYRQHLRLRGDEQYVMIGYSDSNKDAGIAAARWALQRAQAALVRVADRHQIRLTLFHGRGGTVSRGGTSPRDAILGAPIGSVRGRLRMTEQGEIIHAKYGLPAMAKYTLEYMASALLEVAEAELRGDHQPPPEQFFEVMETIATHSKKAYRALVDHQDFIEYFQNATPLDVIERMTISSRPTRRYNQPSLSDLRAIPWVFAWTQARQIVPGWYGVGSGIREAIRVHGLPLLQQMTKEWRFFDVLLSDVEMVLAKVDLDIGARYAALVPQNTIFPLIQDEFDATVQGILTLRKASALLEHDPKLAQLIRVRSPFLDPISVMQVDLLARWRAGNREDKALEESLISSVIGVARGMQNTG